MRNLSVSMSGSVSKSKALLSWNWAIVLTERSDKLGQWKWFYKKITGRLLQEMLPVTTKPKKNSILIILLSLKSDLVI